MRSACVLDASVDHYRTRACQIAVADRPMRRYDVKRRQLPRSAEAQLERFRATPRIRVTQCRGAEDQSEQPHYVPIRVGDDPCRVGEDPEQLSPIQFKAGLLTDFAHDRCFRMLAIFQAASRQAPWVDSLIRRFNKEYIFILVDNDSSRKYLKQGSYDSRCNILKPAGKYPPNFK